MALQEAIERLSCASINAMQERIQALYRQAGSAAQHDALLSSAFEELTVALELLQTADDRLHQQQEQWLNHQAALEQECQRYKDLFAQAPAAYVVTSGEGTIRQANGMASTLLACAEAMLIGRTLSYFVQEGQRMAFRHRLGPLIQAELPQVWHFRMRSWQERPFAAELVVSPLRGARGRVSGLAWLIQDISERSHATAAPME